jgi:hypothetical protein
MKKMKMLTIGAMLSMAAFSVVAACVIATEPACPSEVNTNPPYNGVKPPHGFCENITDDYPSARGACVGETGLDTVTSLPPQCLYICDDGTQQYYFIGITVSGNSCNGAETSGQCGG